MAAYTTIDNPELYMQVKLYTGNGTDDTAITLDGDENMQPDLVWLKRRDNAGRNRLFDSVRGATKWLRVDDTDAEGTAADSLKSFDSDGFTLGADSASGGINVNINNETMVAWCWKESADSGMDIVSYTGNGSTRTISHSLSAVPHLMIQKKLSGSAAWTVYHHKMASDPETDYLYLSSTAAVADYNLHWNDTAPTSSVFTLGTDTSINGDGSTNIMYLFTGKQGFSKFGSYTGNGNADGPYIYTGFRPAWVMIKRTDSTNGWFIMDDQRVGFNSATTNSATLGNVELNANTSRSEAEGNTNMMDILSNGFKCRQSGSDSNTSGGTYIYMAFAKAPFVNSNGVPCNAR